MTYVLVISGTRHGRSDTWAVLDAIVAERGEPSLVVVGDADGVDEQAYQWARQHVYAGIRKCVRDELGSPAKFHDRNQRMVDHGGPGDVFVALPCAKSRGTYDALARARKRGLTCLVYGPETQKGPRPPEGGSEPEVV
jgi:hypothetical protein